MTWVLILRSDYINEPAAVIGGYNNREEAETAGNLATEFSNVDKERPHYRYYWVVPGAACSGPIGSTHSQVKETGEFDPMLWPLLERVTKRY